MWGGPAYYNGPTGPSSTTKRAATGCTRTTFRTVATPPGPFPQAVHNPNLALGAAADSFLNGNFRRGLRRFDAGRLLKRSTTAHGNRLAGSTRRRSTDLEAYDALNVNSLLFSATAGTWSNSEDNGFVTPLVANGKVYVPGTNAITVFGL